MYTGEYRAPPSRDRPPDHRHRTAFDKRERANTCTTTIMYDCGLPPDDRSGQRAAVRLAADSLSHAAGDARPMGAAAAPAPPRHMVIIAAAERVFPAGPFNGFLRDAFKTPLTRLTPEPAPKSPPTPPNAPLYISISYMTTTRTHGIMCVYNVIVLLYHVYRDM